MDQHLIERTGTGGTMCRGPVGATVGEAFARSLAAKDAAGLKALLRPGVDFRAMTPGRFWQSDDVDDIVDATILGTWFDTGSEIVGLLGLETEEVGGLERVGYRFGVSRPDGEFVVAQQAFLEVRDGTIGWLRIMCAGYRPVDHDGGRPSPP